MPRFPIILVLLAVVASGCQGRGGDQGELGSGTSVIPAGTSVTPARPVGEAAPLPSALTEVAGTAWGGRMVIVGGLDQAGRASQAVHIYDPVDDAWSGGPPLPVALHHTAVVAGGDDRLWVIGGYGNESGAWVAKAEVWSLGSSDSQWREEPPLSVARGALAATVVGGTLVAAGGATAGDGASDSASRVVEFLDTDSDRWHRGPDLFEQREHLAAAITGDRVVVMGGRVGGLDTNLRSVESWRPGENTWRRESPLHSRRGGFAAATAEGVPCVAGGEQPDGTIPVVECLRGGRWSVTGQLSVPRHGLAVVALSGRMHAVGGGPKPGLFVSTTHEVLDVGW